MALAHRYCAKQKLELNFVDRTSGFAISKYVFANLFNWTSGDWYQNQASANIAFMPTGGTFTAGTGRVKLNLEDCVTYSKDGLINTTTYTNG